MCWHQRYSWCTFVFFLRTFRKQIRMQLYVIKYIFVHLNPYILFISRQIDRQRNAIRMKIEEKNVKIEEGCNNKSIDIRGRISLIAIWNFEFFERFLLHERKRFEDRGFVDFSGRKILRARLGQVELKILFEIAVHTSLWICLFNERRTCYEGDPYIRGYVIFGRI